MLVPSPTCLGQAWERAWRSVGLDNAMDSGHQDIETSKLDKLGFHQDKQGVDQKKSIISQAE